MSTQPRNEDVRATATAVNSSLVTRHSSFLSWIGAAGIVSIAVMRCCIAFVPQLLFDTDPALDSAPIAALGMGGSLLLDAALILACLFALVGEWRSGRGLDPLLLVLALLPAPIIFWHGCNDAGNLWRGSTWLAAAIACVAIAHLARERTMRIIVTATLLAVIAPLLIRGAIQMTWEHDATVEAYRQNKETFLRMRGWDADSPAVRIYERRLSNREPTGWFPSTNIYGSAIGAAVIMCAGLGWCAFAAFRRNTIQSGAWFLLMMLVLLCLSALWFTTSMGALLATGAGALALIVMMAATPPHAISSVNHRPDRGYLPRWAGAMILVMIFGATAGVIVRGAILSEGFLGERSLLFRWHYLKAAVDIVSDHHLLGAGPDGFQVAYTQHRPPRNPEEVQSAHAMFTDWIAMLGLAGGAWVAMIITLVVRRNGGPGVSPGRETTGHTDTTQSNAPATTGRAARLALAVVLIGFAPAIIIEWPALNDRDLFLRLIMGLGFIALAAFTASVLDLCNGRTLRVIAAAASVVLLVHGQIEMTFFQGGSVAWALAFVGLIGSPRGTSSRSSNGVIVALAAIALLIASGWILVQGALPALAQERQMLAAARMLDPVRENQGKPDIALRQRPLAAEALVKAYETWPINPQPLNAAADQLMLAAGALGSSGSAPLGLLMRAEEIIDRAVASHQHPSSVVLAMNVHANLAALTDDAEQWTRAIALGRRMTDLDPYSVGAWQRLGRVLWAAGAREEAAAAYQTAIANSDNFDLDPMKQLSDAARAELQARIAEASRVLTTNPQ